jgi:hypothetical protein
MNNQETARHRLSAAVSEPMSIEYAIASAGGYRDNEMGTQEYANTGALNGSTS